MERFGTPGRPSFFSTLSCPQRKFKEKFGLGNPLQIQDYLSQPETHQGAGVGAAVLYKEPEWQNWKASKASAFTTKLGGPIRSYHKTNSHSTSGRVSNSGPKTERRLPETFSDASSVVNRDLFGLCVSQQD